MMSGRAPAGDSFTIHVLNNYTDMSFGVLADHLKLTSTQVGAAIRTEHRRAVELRFEVLKARERSNGGGPRTALFTTAVGGIRENPSMSRTCDQCGHDISTRGGEGRFSVHDRNGNAEELFGPRIASDSDRCAGSLLHPVDDQNAPSIHTTSGGLPGLGKRR